jgi:predicted alpha/beta superfamily hydrolase
MKKIVLISLLFGLVIFGFFKARGYYYWKQEEKRRAAFYENLVDTSSPTVSKDSILIAYQNDLRPIHIYVPPDYAKDSTSTYPVIYMMDGESSFNDLENMGPEWQIDEVINAASKEGRQTAIVIGINQAEDRDAEYTPFMNDDNPDAHGTEFANWVATDLKAWVDQKFRTKTDAASTSIGGISRSGMMAYFMMMQHPEVFGNAIIQSPSMWVDADKLFAMTLTKEQLRDKKIFVSVGQYEGNIMIPHAEEVYEKFSALGLGDNQIKFQLIENESHWHITWRKSFALAYPWLIE